MRGRVSKTLRRTCPAGAATLHRTPLVLCSSTVCNARYILRSMTQPRHISSSSIHNTCSTFSWVAQCAPTLQCSQKKEHHTHRRQNNFQAYTTQWCSCATASGSSQVTNVALQTIAITNITVHIRQNMSLIGGGTAADAKGSKVEQTPYQLSTLTCFP